MFVRPSRLTRYALGTLHAQIILNFSNQFPAFWWDLKDFYKCFHKTST